MKLRELTIAICILLALSGCSSVRSISTRDSAAGSTTFKKANRPTGKREFLNGIEVTPGGMVANAKTNTASAKKQEKVPKQTIT